MGEVRLFCFLDGGGIDEPFPIEINKAQTIGNLKNLVKNELKTALEGVDAPQLAVYKVSVPDGDAAELRRTIAGIDPEKDKLRPSKKVGDVFRSPAEEHIHVIIRIPDFQFRPSSSALGRPLVPNTPPRRSSTSWSGVPSDNSRNTIDPLIRAELGNCAYRDVAGFHTLLGIAEQEWSCAVEHEEGCSCGLGQEVPLPPWPRTPTETAVVKWFDDWNESIKSMEMGFYGSGKQSQNLVDSRSGKAGTTGGRGCDIFLSISGLQSPYSWRDVLVLGELKQGVDWDTKRKNLLLDSIASSAREVFGAQPGRCFVHAFSISGSIMRCYLFDRGGVVASQPFDITRNGKTSNLFGNVLRAYCQMDARGLGYDSGYETESGEVYLPAKHRREDRFVKVAGQRFRIVREISYGAAIVSRATLCWLAENEQQTPCIVKDAWRSIFREFEGRLYEEAQMKGVWGLADCRHQEEIEIDGATDIRSGIRKGLMMDPANMYKLAEDPDGPGSATASRSKHQSSNRGQRKRKQPDGEPSDTKRVGSTETFPAHWNRIHSRLVCFRIGRPIFEFRAIAELLEAFVDAIKGHRELVDRCDILHRDISLHNIMITESANGKEGDPKGFLIDLDMASRVSSESNSGAFHRTGTFEFMAIEILERSARHSYRHDLESFFYVLLWICIHYTAAGNLVQPRPTILDGWSGSVTSAAAEKISNMGPSRFNRLLANLGDGFEVLKAMLVRLRDKLFLRNSGEPFIGTPFADHQRLYDDIIHVIDGQLIELRARGGT